MDFCSIYLDLHFLKKLKFYKTSFENESNIVLKIANIIIHKHLNLTTIFIPILGMYIPINQRISKDGLDINCLIPNPKEGEQK